jgi:hypothetical protein
MFHLRLRILRWPRRSTQIQDACQSIWYIHHLVAVLSIQIFIRLRLSHQIRWMSWLHPWKIFACRNHLLVVNLIHSLHPVRLLACMGPQCLPHLLMPAFLPIMLTALAYHLLKRVVYPIIAAGLLRKVLESSLHLTKVCAFQYHVVMLLF